MDIREPIDRTMEYTGLPRFLLHLQYFVFQSLFTFKTSIEPVMKREINSHKIYRSLFEKSMLDGKRNFNLIYFFKKVPHSELRRVSRISFDQRQGTC